ncbi:MAG TPA: choice-of-anchor D domain-containing protein [Thermoanaerobaculia bacterium]|jgi:hypothetical protein
MRQITVRLGDYVEEEKRRERRGGRAVAVVALVALGVVAMSHPSPVSSGTPARLTASSAALRFSPQLAGTASAAQLVRLSNSGGQLLSIARIVSDNDAFRPSYDCGGTLAPNESCSVAVVFAPAGGGTQAADIAVETNAGTTKISLSGEGKAIPPVDLGPTDFGRAQVGTAVERTVRFMNSGAMPLSMKAAVSAPFEIADDACAGTIAPGGNCEVRLRFRPATGGSATGELRLAGVNGAMTAKGALLGTGVGEGPPPPPDTAAHLAATPSALDFPPQPAGTTSAERPVRLQNDGGSALAIVNVTVKGDAFRLSNRCGTALAPNAACSVAVVFAPAFEGKESGTLTIVTNGGTAEIPLSGQTPPRAPVATLDPIEFGRTLLGAPVERAVRFVNSSALPIAVGKATTNAPFAVSADGCRNAKLPPGGGCEIRVQFQPAGAGGVKGELVLVDPRGDVVAHRLLSGTGFKPATPAHLSTAPQALLFPQQSPGTTSDTRIVQVRNDGGEEMTIRTIAARGEAFRAASRCGNTLAPNEACSIAVAYAPPAAGKHGGTLAIVTTGGTAMIPLGGEAPAPAVLRIDPTDFGRAYLGQRVEGRVSPAQAVERVTRFINRGRTTIVIGKAAVSQPFQISADGCSNATLPPGGGCAIRLLFRPAAIGGVKGNLLLVDPRGNVVAAGVLTGIGLSPASANGSRYLGTNQTP